MKVLPALILIALLAVVAATAGFLLARSFRAEDVSAAIIAPGQVSVIGNPAPPLSVERIDGGKLDLTSYRGRTVVLNFWASWCGPCVEEMPLLDHFSVAAKDRGISVVGIAVEDADAVRAFLQEFPVTYPIGLGSSGSPDESAAFGNRRSVLPFSVLIDPSGIVRRVRTGAFSDGELVDWSDVHSG